MHQNPSKTTSRLAGEIGEAVWEWRVKLKREIVVLYGVS